MISPFFEKRGGKITKDNSLRRRFGVEPFLRSYKHITVQKQWNSQRKKEAVY